MFLSKSIVKMNGAADISAFLTIRSWEKAALESGENKIAKLTFVENKMFGAEEEFARGCGVRDQSVIGANAHRELLIDHLLEGVIFERFKIRNGLQIARGTNLDSNALIGDIFAKLFDVFGLVFNGFEFDGVLAKEKGAVADAVGMAFGDGLEDGFGAIGFTGMDGFTQKMAVSVLEGGFVVDGGITRLFSRKVEADNG